MKILEMAKARKKAYTDGKSTHESNKDIGLMNFDELTYEINYIFLKYRKSVGLNERSKEIFREYFSCGRHIDFNISQLLNLCLPFESDNITKQLFDIYFEEKEAPQEYLENFTYNNIINFETTNDVKLERKINNIKRTINSFTDKITKPFRKEKKIETEQHEDIEAFILENGLQKYRKNPLELKVTTPKETAYNEKNQQTIDFIRTLILEKCYEEMDLDKLLTHSETYYVLKIYEILPEDRKIDFIKMYLNSEEFSKLYSEAQKEVLEVFKSNLSREDLIELQLGNRYSDETTFEELEITNQELFRYFIKNKGHMPYGMSDKMQEALEEVSFEELKSYLENIEEPDEYSLYFVYSRMTQEEKKQILESENIHQKIKDAVFSNLIYDLSNDERIKMFDEASEEEQKKFWLQFKSSSRGEDRNAYEAKFYEKIKDTDYQKIYGIMELDKPCSPEELAELIDKIDCYDYRKILLTFSDDEIKTIYEKIKNENVRETILRLNRKKSTYSFDKKLTDEEIREIEEYNKTVPENILINESTILHYLKNAISLREYHTLLYRREIDNLEFSEILECYKLFFEKKDLLSNDRFYKSKDIESTFKSRLIEKAVGKNFIQLIKENILDKKYVLKLDKNFYRGFNKDDLNTELELIEELDDIDLRKHLIQKLNEEMTRNLEEYHMSSGEKIIANREKLQNTEKINLLYKERILNKNISLENKYLYLGMLLHNYYDSMRESDNKAYHEKLMIEFKALFEKINIEANKPEYNNIFNFMPQYKKSDFSARDLLTTYYYNIAECLPHLANDKVYELMQKLHNSNSNIQNVINSKFLNEKIINTVDYEVIEYLSRYGKSLESNSYGKDGLSDAKLDLFIKAYDRLKTIKTYPEEDSIKLVSIIQKLTDTEINETDFENENNIDLLLLISLQKDIADEFSKIKNQGEINRFELFKEKNKENARKDAHSPFITRRKILNAIGKRFFNYSYKEMIELKMKYNADFKEIYEIYREKSRNGELSLEEENELKSLTIFRNISELMEVKDTKALVRVFDELDQQEEYENCDFAAMAILEENLKRVYSKDLERNAYTPNEKDKKGQVDGIDIYSPKEFKMFVHVVAAFGKYKLIDKDNLSSSAKDKWNSDENKKNHILCTSYIGNDNMCYVRIDDKTKKANNLEDEQIIFGFGNVSNTEIIMASQSDIGSDTQNIASDNSFFLSKFRLANKIYRTCRHGHNEVDLERRLKNNKNANIQPEYIVCFDEISEISKKVAKDFNIPIVLIDKREVAKNQSEKLNEIVQKFKNTKKPELLEDIINLYQCARHSFNVGKKDKALAEEFFSPENMNQTVEDLINIIEQERKIGNKENANNCYLALYTALDNEVKICKEEPVEPESFSDSRFHLRKFRHDLKQIIKNNNITKSSDQINSGDEITQDTMHQVISNERKSDENAR